MNVKKTSLTGVYVLNLDKFEDERGFFSRKYCKKILKKSQINFDIKQVNYAFNKKKYTLRGFHYQIKPYSEKKIMTCLTGSFLLYIVDIDKNSNTYKKKIKILMSPKKNKSVIIPNNCANAYLTLQKSTSLMYLMSNFYRPEMASGIRYDDPTFNFRWPAKPKIISKKDLSFPNF